MSTETLLLALLGFALVLLNGFFVAAEFAIVKLRRTQAEELAKIHGLRGRTLRTVRTHLDAYLSACQLGITLASLGLGWVGEPAFARLLEPLLTRLGVIDPEVVFSISVVVAFLFISFLHIVLGELAPKSVAIRRAEQVSLNAAIPLYLFYWLMYPFIRVLNGTANVIVRRPRRRARQRRRHRALGRGTAQRAQGQSPSRRARSHRDADPRARSRARRARGRRPHAAARGAGLDSRRRRHRPGARGSALVALHALSGPRCGELATSRASCTSRTWSPATNGCATSATSRPTCAACPYVSDDSPLPRVLAAFRSGDPHFAIVTNVHGTEIGFVTFEHVVEALFGPSRTNSRRRARRGSNPATAR
jgi:CBS domain containing-hemolysin-like protein